MKRKRTADDGVHAGASAGAAKEQAVPVAVDIDAVTATDPYNNNNNNNNNTGDNVYGGLMELADGLTDLTDSMVHVMTRSIAVQREKTLLDRQELQSKIAKHRAETEVCQLQKQSLLLEQERADLEMLETLEEKIQIARAAASAAVAVDCDANTNVNVDSDEQVLVPLPTGERTTTTSAVLCLQWEMARDRCLARLNARDVGTAARMDGGAM